MEKQMQIGEENGKFFLIGPDGYSTTTKKWDTKAEAKIAMRKEMIEETLEWEY